jgi:Double-GTPase 2
MPLIRKRVTCPYCDNEIFLGDCAIVATNRPDNAGSFGADLFGGEEAAGSPPGGFPVLVAPPAPPPPPPPPKGFLHAVFDALTSIPEEPAPDEPEDVPPVSAYRHLSWADLPARACYECGTPLPDEIGEREILKIGIVGTLGAGKTHFLTALLREAGHEQGLRKWGIGEFELDETSSDVYQSKYESFWHDGQVLESTNMAEAAEVVFKPLIVRMTFPQRKKVLLYFYDIDGETLSNRGLRARHARYLRRPHGLIFLIDPVRIDAIRARLPVEGPEYQRYDRQSRLVKACLGDLAPDLAGQVPVAIALSKSDLVLRATAPGLRFTFGRPPDDGDTVEARVAEMAEIHREVRGILGSAGERDLLAAADGLGPHAPVTFHAVAPIGSEPRPAADGSRVAEQIRPLRCLDPLIALLAPWVRDQIKADE